MVSFNHKKNDSDCNNFDQNTLPKVIFTCPKPVEKNSTIIQLFGGSSSFPLAANSLPIQLGTAAQGKVCYCSIILQTSSIDNNKLSMRTLSATEPRLGFALGNKVLVVYVWYKPGGLGPGPLPGSNVILKV
jgi:hypothetical protein